LFDQVRDDLGVGLGDELVALRGELALEFEIIFDDAVVDDDDAAGAVAVRVRVLFGGAAVRGPARVADAECAVERMLAQTSSSFDSLPAARRSSSFSLPGWPRRSLPSRSRGIRGALAPR
jgi:hypothetical protein